MEKDTTKEIEYSKLVSQYEHVSKTVHRTTMVLLSLCLYGLATLYSKSDVHFIVKGAGIKLPYTDVSIPILGFIIFVPFIILGIFIYFTMHLQELTELQPQINKEDTVPYFFNLKSNLSIAISFFLFYVVIPATLIMFSWKANPMLLECIITLGCLFLNIVFIALYQNKIIPKMFNFRKPFLIVIRVIFWFFALFVLFIFIDRLSEDRIFIRNMDLYKAKLNGKDLRGVNLAHANIREANLEEANLCNVNFKKAYLEGAKLKNSKLFKAHLEGAHLEKANLEGAHLFKAHLEGAHLEGAKLKGAYLAGANLEGAKLKGVDLYGAELNNTNLERANLEGAELTKANFGRAKFEGAIMSVAWKEYIKRFNVKGYNSIQWQE